jgi:alpha-amylase
MGGDIKGITEKIKEGYFNKLGVNAIWLTPIVEQIHGSVDEGDGATYGYHGYWAKDWTRIDPNYGTEEDLHELVKTAHEHGIRILLDVVINHTGPVTSQDPLWPSSWVRTGPRCSYKDYKTAVTCTLTDNLPDIKTESTDSVGLPEHLKAKWEKEGRLQQELEGLDAFFKRTGLVRTPVNYLIKWLTDFIRKFGIDGYRIDTVKHVEENIWADLIREAKQAFKDWKAANPEAVLDDNEFYILGELYGYNIYSGRYYDFGDRKIDYFYYGFESMINFGFKYDANKSFEDLFSYYSSRLQNELKGKNVANYITSHDDGQPFDRKREKSMDAATKLMLCPGAVQIYYGDETNRLLDREGEKGDANLRTYMNWEDLEKNNVINGLATKDLLIHWQKLGTFRNSHPAVGAGIHKMISENPYYFSRIFKSEKIDDVVVAGLDLAKGKKEVLLEGIFENGTKLYDYYSGKTVKVKNGKAELDTEFNIVLLGITN